MSAGDRSALEDAERLGALMQHLGFALWQLQLLEDSLATYVVIRVLDSRGVGAEQGALLSKDVQNKTMGALITSLRKAGVLSPAVSSRLEELLKDRNWLIHHARRENHGILASESRLATLIGKLEGIANSALATSKALAAEIEDYVTRSGVSPEFIEHEAARLRRSWEAQE